jgi:hypothetical protein
MIPNKKANALGRAEARHWRRAGGHLAAAVLAIFLCFIKPILLPFILPAIAG